MKNNAIQNTKLNFIQYLKTVQIFMPNKNLEYLLTLVRKILKNQ